MGAGTDRIRIQGVKELRKDGTYSVVPDQIEAGTFMLAAVATRGDITIKNCITKHLESITAKIIEMGAKVEDLGGDSIRVSCSERPTKIDIKTMPYPGFPTDMQSVFASMLTTAKGTSIIIENIFENRFKFTQELNKMGSKITIEGKSAIIRGVRKLYGTKVNATDLRGGAALVLAGLIAKGETQVNNIEYILRGYDNLDKKLSSLGANIKIM